MGQIKEFVTAAEKVTDEPDLVFTVDGEELRAFKPTEGQFALLVMAMGRHVSDTEQFAGVIDFFISVLDDASQKYVIDRMMSRVNIIPMDDIVEIMKWMVEEWGGRPTQPLSGSTSSRRNGGRRSTVTSTAST